MRSKSFSILDGTGAARLLQAEDAPTHYLDCKYIILFSPLKIQKGFFSVWQITKISAKNQKADLTIKEKTITTVKIK